MKLKYKRFILPLIDILIIIIAYWLAGFLRYEGAIPEDAINGLAAHTALALIISISLSIVCNCYNSLWQYAGIEVMVRQGIVAALSSFILLILKYFVVNSMSGSITLIYGILLFIMSSGIRTASRFLAWVKQPKDVKRAVIIGAGSTGAMLIKRTRSLEIIGKANENFYPVAVIDNDPKKTGLKICGVKIAGDIASIEHICKKYRAKEIIIALPNITNDELHDIYKKCVHTNLPIKSCHNFTNVKDYLQKDKIALKNITVEDLLFRDIIKNDMTAARKFIKGNVVMVTGGAGSIGSELCRQALEFGCSLLVVYDFNENGLYEIDEGLNGKFNGFERSRYKLCLGSVRDNQRLHDIISKYKPDVVFHAAAHKHVPMAELNPFEAIKNNVAGTINVINACIYNNVSKFILISTDKAVNPVNIMGASKRIAELFIENLNKKSNITTELAVVRFGNVLGSNGSVIPKFKRQIDNGGPVTLTHRDMIRYFMTIPEAVGLVLTAGAFAKGGEIFVLDMGRPVKIYDLAADLIRLSGYEPEVDIKIEITGIRPGEKLYEELFLNNETVDRTSHNKLFVSKSKHNQNLINFDVKLKHVLNIAEAGQNEKELREAVFALVKAYENQIKERQINKEKQIAVSPALLSSST
jgi:FlaA1/EpsC-like NDP-sugar epimerase